MKSGQSSVELRSAKVHAMVVIPEGRGPLLLRVDVELAPSVKRPSRLGTVPMVGVGGATPREYQVGGVAVALRWRSAPVQVRRDRNRQLITVANNDLATAAALDGGTGEDSIVAPERRPEPGQDLGLSFLGRDLIVVCGGSRPRKPSASVSGQGARIAGS